MHPALTRDDVETVAAAIRGFAEARRPAPPEAAHSYAGAGRA
jgi:hypothetical protein